MMKLAGPTVAILLLTVLAGCSEGPSRGELADGQAPPQASGSVTAAYQPAVRPLNNTVPGQNPCVPPQVPVSQLQCVDPSSNYTVSFTAPMAGASGYRAWLVGPAPATDREIGALVAGAADPMSGMQTYALNVSFAEDLQQMYDTLEIRMDGFVYATAAVAAGLNEFSVLPANLQVTVDGSYEGEVLTVTVANLPANATYVGWLYRENAEGVAEPVQSFPGLSEGENQLAAPEDIESYQEFHIHVADSKINLYQAAIES